MSHISKYINDIKNAATFFEQHFVGKEMHYITRNRCIALNFKRSNFMHLCGLRYEKGANQFFKDILHNKLDISKLTTKQDGTTILKLSALTSVEHLVKPKIRLTDCANYLNLSFDSALRTNKQIIALTLKNEKENTYYPNSFLNLKSIKDFPDGEEIICIKSIHLETNEVIVYYSIE